MTVQVLGRRDVFGCAAGGDSVAQPGLTVVQLFKFACVVQFVQVSLLLVSSARCVSECLCPYCSLVRVIVSLLLPNLCVTESLCP